MRNKVHVLKVVLAVIAAESVIAIGVMTAAAAADDSLNQPILYGEVASHGTR